MLFFCRSFVEFYRRSLSENWKILGLQIKVPLSTKSHFRLTDMNNDNNPFPQQVMRPRQRTVRVKYDSIIWFGIITFILISAIKTNKSVGKFRTETERAETSLNLRLDTIYAKMVMIDQAITEGELVKTATNMKYILERHEKVISEIERSMVDVKKQLEMLENLKDSNHKLAGIKSKELLADITGLAKIMKSEADSWNCHATVMESIKKARN